MCRYLLYLFNLGTKSGMLNSIRSAISFFTQHSSLNLGSDMTVSRLFKFFYKERPMFPRYLVTWDVGKLLKFLAAWHPVNSISLKQLTLKTVALIALTSSDRAQTLHLMDVELIHTTPQGDLEFEIPALLKTRKGAPKRGLPPKKVVCVSWDAAELDVAGYVAAYSRKAFKFRMRAVNKGLPKPTQFFLSHKTGKPVQRATISRWLRQVMELSGIDISTFKPGSTRGASSSMARRQGATPDQILKHGDWSNLGTYQKYYNRDLEQVPVGKLILRSSQCEFTFFLIVLVFFILKIGCTLGRLRIRHELRFILLWRSEGGALFIIHFPQQVKTSYL